MKSLSAALNSHIAGEVTTLATCWALTRQDGTEMFFTDFDEDLVIDGDTYLAASGYSRSAIANSSSFSVDNLDIIGNLTSDVIREEDLFAGLYDFAEVRIFMVNWQDLSQGTIPLRRGWIGEVSAQDGAFTAELRGLAQALLYEVGEVYSPLCGADLGDSRCGVDVEAITQTDVVASVTSRDLFTLTDYNGADDVLNGGVLTFTSGANVGRSCEIRDWTQSGKTLTLYLEMPYEVQAGDEVSFFPGCDKRYATCRDTYSNHLNFRGFPHIPGTDALLETGDA
ncbi:DUF2163 domain-containing protein [Sneathiella litorea]|uniref:DUF2163 domain-containing protein n=1 Tax=Sneathiella litorea TaxID=2606216 RepID=A0A6L8W701_9PROT|nr:DUF2163 domain-containing protein [Sneathiella litorea]MZR30895.1 DUF2163 domain-containing protein [Sneathiella litorea]